MILISISLRNLFLKKVHLSRDCFSEKFMYFGDIKTIFSVYKIRSTLGHPWNIVTVDLKNRWIWASALWIWGGGHALHFWSWICIFSKHLLWNSWINYLSGIEKKWKLYVFFINFMTFWCGTSQIVEIKKR